jgi:RNA polymerase sigma factor (sigma-70 family)
MQIHTGRLVEAAFVEHRAPLVRHLTVVARNADVAEDLAQEAFVRLARELEAGRSPDDIGAWLHRVGTNLTMSRGRHLQVVDRHAAALAQPSVAPGPEHVVVERELTAAVGTVLAEMSLTERRALTLAAHGYEGAEIAASIGRTAGATRTLLCRARARIRERVELAGFATA